MNESKTHDTMNPEEQDIAIFESLGWKYLPPVKRDSSFIVRPENLPRWKKGREIAYKDDIPSYGTDLNAMHEAEKSLPSSLTQKYWWSLCDVTGLDQYEAYRDPLLTVSATAPQRREAFLRTIEKWVTE